MVRNRVETGYRGKASYHEAVLDPFQFSAFNSANPKRGYYLNLGLTSSAPGWQRALSIAHHVRNAPANYRPFPIGTRHFFSERSMPDQRHPDWAVGLKPVSPTRVHYLDHRRFRFYAGVA